MSSAEGGGMVFAALVAAPVGIAEAGPAMLRPEMPGLGLLGHRFQRPSIHPGYDRIAPAAA